MAAPASSDEFLQLVRKSGVVDEKRLTAYEQQLRSSGGIPDEPGKLAGFMVRDGLLTHFQAEQFLLGKWRRFTIGKYKVLERLGSGGMGSVYLCEHKFMRRRVAVKVLPAAKAEDAASLERFYREARAAAALDHPNIVRAYDIDQDENLHFLVMEYVDGASLQEVIKKQGPMSLLYAAHYTRQSAVGLQHAHEAGLVHRDIKPGNVLVDRAGTVKVLDMGLARFFNDEEDILTKKYDESVLGTADYLAPEQALDSHNVDIRADIYSLGATFYFCLTGSPPFSEGTVAQKLIWHQTRQPKPIRTFRQDVPEGLAAVVDRMMQKDKSKRFQTPAQVIEALAPWTAKPIQPPPDTWMPRLSIAARGEGDGPSTSSAPTPAPMANLSTVPVRPTPAASALGNQRVPVPAAVATATPAPIRTQASPAPMPQPIPHPVAAGAYQQDSNGRSSPAAAHVEDVAPNWGALVDGQPSSRKQRSSIRRAPGGPGAVQKLLMQVRKRPRLYLAISAGFVGLVFFIGLVLFVARLLSGPSAPKTPPSRPSPAKISVAPWPEPGDCRTVREALEKAQPGDTVVVRHDTHEEFLDFQGLEHHVHDVVIEGETTSGKPVIWRPPTGAIDGQPPKQLLRVGNCENLTLRGFLFDGQSPTYQPPHLLLLFGHCPGLLLEKLQFQNFRNSAIKLLNCAGNAEHPLVLRDLSTHGNGEAVAALTCEMTRDYTSVLSMEHIRVTDCLFQGPAESAVNVVLTGGCSLREVTFEHNRFSRSTNGFLVRRPNSSPAPLLRMALIQNTFFQVPRAGARFELLRLAEGSQLSLKENLFLQTGALARVDEADLPAGAATSRPTNARWLRAAEEDRAKSGTGYFRKVFTIPRGQLLTDAVLDIATDESCLVFLNGKTWKGPLLEPGQLCYGFDVAPFLRADGNNVLAVQALNKRGPAQALVELRCAFGANAPLQPLVVSDASWKSATAAPDTWAEPTFNDSAWPAAREVRAAGPEQGDRLVWESVTRDSIRQLAEKFIPADTGSVRDAASAEWNVALRSTVKDCSSVVTNAANERFFLRYAGTSPLNSASLGKGPVGAPPIN